MDLAIMTGYPQCTRLFLNISPPPSTLMERRISLTTFVFGLRDSESGRLMSRTPTHHKELSGDPKLPEGALPMLETRISSGITTLCDAQSASTNRDSFEFGDIADVLQDLFDSGCDLQASDAFWERSAHWTNEQDMALHFASLSKLGVHRTNEQDTALHHACFITNPDLISFLITKVADFNRQNDRGETPLHRACSRYETSGETIRRLIQHGANVNELDEHGCSPLDKACEFASIGVIQCLVANGAVIKAQGDLGYHPLHSVCKRSTDLCHPAETMEIIDYIVSLSDPDVILVECEKSEYQDGEVTPLHLAIRAKNWEAVDHLRALGAELTDLGPLTLYLWLCAADARGHSFRRLLGLGASPTGKCSLLQNETIIAHWFSRNYRDDYQFGKPADDEFEENLRALQQAGADINARCYLFPRGKYEDITVLHYARGYGLHDSFELILLRNGALEDDELEEECDTGQGTST
jgi:hypothetical protein